MANLPLVDTMHHALQAWCIFAAFVLTHRDNEDKRDKMRRAPQELSFHRTFFCQPEAALQLILSGMYLENTQNKRAKTHACVCCNRKRTNYAAFILSAPIVCAMLSAKIKPRYCLLPQHLSFFVHSPANTSSKRCP